MSLVGIIFFSISVVLGVTNSYFFHHYNNRMFSKEFMCAEYIKTIEQHKTFHVWSQYISDSSIRYVMDSMNDWHFFAFGFLVCFAIAVIILERYEDIMKFIEKNIEVIFEYPDLRKGLKCFQSKHVGQWDTTWIIFGDSLWITVDAPLCNYRTVEILKNGLIRPHSKKLDELIKDYPISDKKKGLPTAEELENFLDARPFTHDEIEKILKNLPDPSEHSVSIVTYNNLIFFHGCFGRLQFPIFKNNLNPSFQIVNKLLISEYGKKKHGTFEKYQDIRDFLKKLYLPDIPPESLDDE